MNIHPWSFFTAILLGACSSPDQGANKAIIDQTSISEKEIKSPYPTIPVGKGPDALFITPDHSILYVANVEDSIISVVDTQRDEIFHNISGIRNPWGFTQLGESDLVAVSGWDKQIVIIDFTKHEIILKKTFESNLGGITSSSGGEFIYVIGISDKKVFQLNAELEIIDQFETGNGPDGIGISKDNNNLYVTNTDDGTISIINVKTKENSIITKGGKPELIHPNEDNSILLISNFLNDEAYILHTESDEITHTISDLNGPEEVTMSRNGELIYMVNFKNRKGLCLRNQ